MLGRARLIVENLRSCIEPAENYEVLLTLIYDEPDEVLL